ncbi:MAG TPA: RodZ domain-containing protein [Thermoleophilia bacterium]|nr:RodZ domain-containing protein [Thermoleophilia bacterium]
MFEIGSTLREARVRCKVTLQQAEDDTKIRVKYIQAMENEDFDVMPSPAYVKGFLRTYSEYLGLDPVVMLQEYRSRFEPNEEHEPFGGHSALGKPRAHRRRNTVAFVAVICLLILGVLYVLGRDNNSNQNGQGQIPVTNVPSTSPSTKASSSPRPSGSPTPTLLTVKVTADRGDCWLEARRANAAGKVLYMATLPQGSVRTFHTPGSALYLRLGVPAYVSIRVTGKGSYRPADLLSASYRVTKKGVVKL